MWIERRMKTTVLYAVLRCMVGCMVPADFKMITAGTWLVVGGIVQEFSGSRVPGAQ